MLLKRILVVLLGTGMSLSVQAQTMDSATGKLMGFPSRWMDKVVSRTERLDREMSLQTQKYVQQMIRREKRLKRKLCALDSNAAKDLFVQSGERYAALSQRLQKDTGWRSMRISGPYEPYTDSLRGVLSFLQQNPHLSEGMGKASLQGQEQLQKAVSQLRALQAKMQDANDIQQYMQQRKEVIQQYLSKYTSLPSDITHAFSKYKASAQYYEQQINQYRDMLNDPDKLFKTALEVLNKLPAFSSFMSKNSFLSSLMPTGAPTSDPAQAGQGLPGRDQVLAGIQGQMGPGGGGAATLAQKQTGSAMGQVDQLRNKFNGGQDLDMPDLKNNPERTKSFLRRLELGTNLQTTSRTNFFPATTDIGISLGYKLNEHNRIGVGASYKIGWEGDIHRLIVTSQGAGLRSFVDIQIKNSWFVSGGMELNYQQPVYTLQMMRHLDNWQQSGLIGLSKILSMKTKLVKNTKLQFLWDFLSYRHVPVTQPFKFRVGYSF